jgi:hypothetical protein
MVTFLFAEGRVPHMHGDEPLQSRFEHLLIRLDISVLHLCMCQSGSQT